MNIQKISDTKISVEKVIPEKIEIIEYDYDFLLRQRDAIQAQKDEQMTQRDAELAEIDELLSGADKLGIKSIVKIIK